MAGDSGIEDSLFETRKKKGLLFHRIHAGSLMAGICLIWAYRAANIPASGGARWAWLGLLAADVWFGLYWVLTQSVRWSPVSRKTFKRRLSQRYGDEELPKVDVFVCTADPTIEPPIMVANTILSVMAYDYPSEKLSVYLSDDGGSDLTFYALLEAARFSRVWIPLCRKLNLEPRSPAAFFSGGAAVEDCKPVQKLYEEMEERIVEVTRKGRVPEEVQREHAGFSEWLPGMSSRDHPSIVQILIDGRERDATDNDGHRLPTLVYVAREKKPNWPHNFKAGAMNSLMRVSSEISGGTIILNVDCDMYSSDSKSVRDALCFFMDKREGHEIAFVQFSQTFFNLTVNDLYANSLTIFCEVDFHGMDGVGGPLYIGSGCFHRRSSLMGEKYDPNCSPENLKTEKTASLEESSTMDLQNRAKLLTLCSYEHNTQWGKEVGLKYGCPVEDVITGLAIQSRGWKSIFLNPKPSAFCGIAPLTLSQTILQQKRWAEGDFQILLSPFSLYLFSRHSSAHLLHRMAYSIYFLSAPNCIPTLYYALLPSLSFIARMPLFPEVGSVWFWPFVYVAVTAVGYGLWESLHCGMTVKGWWNEHRMWLYKRTTSCLFAFVETLILKLGFRIPGFVVTPKVAEDGVAARFLREEMEFGAESPPSLDFIILGSIAMINLFCLAVAAYRMGKREVEVLGEFFFHTLICGLLVAINGPVYRAMFFRSDAGRMPAAVTAITTTAAVAAVSFALATTH